MVIDILGEMQSSLLRLGDPKFKVFAEKVDAIKINLSVQRSILTRQVAARSVIPLLPDSCKKALGFALESLPQLKFFRHHLQCFGKFYSQKK